MDCLQQLHLQHKKVLLRVDFNVPLHQQHIVDTTRIDATIATIRYCLEQGASLIIISHLGRPSLPTPTLSLRCCAHYLEKLGFPVTFVDAERDVIKAYARNLKPQQILMLENLRFNPAEQTPDLDPSFAPFLASLADVYVNEAFAACHRNDASISVVPTYFKEKAIGFALQQEVSMLETFFKPLQPPLTVVLGGNKVSSKLSLLKKLCLSAECIMIGGAMAHTFLKAAGYDIPLESVETTMLKEAQQLLENQDHCRIYLPQDLAWGDCIDAVDSINLDIQQSYVEKLRPYDIGTKSTELYCHLLSKAERILWNAPLGVYENSCFAQGSIAIAKAIACSHATSLVAGGDTLAVVNQQNLQQHFSYISTGGGATLAWIAKGSLPGIQAVSNPYSLKSVPK